MKKTTTFSIEVLWSRLAICNCFGCSTLVIQRPMKSLSSVCLSFRTYVCHQFFQDWIISFFSDIVHDDSWPWYLVTDEARFLKKSFAGPNLGPSLDHTLSLKFNTMIVEHLVNMLNLRKKFWGPKFGPNTPKSGRN